MFWVEAQSFVVADFSEGDFIFQNINMPEDLTGFR